MAFRFNAQARLLVEVGMIGVAGGLSAQLFLWLLGICERLLLTGIAGYHPPGVAGTPQQIGPHGLALIPVATAVGGLISGWLVYRWAPEAEGHGTDTAVEAYHRREGAIRRRVPPLKLAASAITIGSGGSAGREGPIALIAAGLGTLYADLTRRGERERRLFLLAGMAAGLSAIFRSPMGTGVFAIEVLYRDFEFETEALLYTMLASAVAFTVNGFFVGFAPLFAVPQGLSLSPNAFPGLAALALAAAAMATLLPAVFYHLRDAFRRLPGPLWIRPAIGGLLLGLLALAFPQVLGGGYGWIQLAINGGFALRLALALAFAKIAAMSLTVSSGGSGGVFAPTLFMGAMLGAALAAVFHQPPAIFAVVGMAAVFGAAARVPLATMLMVTEMVGGYSLLLPAGFVVMTAFLLQGVFAGNLRYPSLYENQVARQTDSPVHQVESIRAALGLLGRRALVLKGNLGHVNLLHLLRSHIGIALPGGRRMDIGGVRPGSRFDGRTIAEVYQSLPAADWEIILVLHQDHVLLPHGQARLAAGDQVVWIGDETAAQQLALELAPAAPPTIER